MGVSLGRLRTNARRLLQKRESNQLRRQAQARTPATMDITKNGGSPVDGAKLSLKQIQQEGQFRQGEVQS